MPDYTNRISAAVRRGRPSAAPAGMGVPGPPLKTTPSHRYHPGMVGRTIGKYRIVEQIGRGGMGTVYKAIDETLDRRVAVKILNADLIDQESIERFRREALTLAKLNHGRIGAIHELARDGHDLLMVMEFLEGETVEKLIERGPMTIPRAVKLCSQVLDALQYAHNAGVVHRDLKPANVMVTPNGDVKVMDFGIARVQGSEHLTTSGYMVGTPAYMAPEQVRGEEVDPRMDLYATAVVLYRMLTQRLPFQGDTAIAMIHSQLTNMPTPPRQFRADLPDWVVGVITKGLSKVPADRFQTAAEFRSALEDGLTGRMPIATAAGDAETLAPMLTPPSMRALVVPPSMRMPVMPSPTGTSSEVPSSIMPPPSAVSPSPAGTGTHPAPAPHAEATVTLRAPHLATAGVLLLLLVVGIGVLAYVALRRAPVVTPPAQTTATAPEPAAQPPAAQAPASTDPDPAAASPAPAAATTPSPASPAPAPAPVAARPAAPAAPSPAAAAPSKPAAAPATASAAAPAAGSAATLSARPAGGRGDAARGGAASKTEPAAPAAANAPAENFGDIKTMVVDGGRGREVDALLSLEPGTLMVRARSDGSLLRTLPYAQIAAATYARTRRPRGQAVPGLADVPDNLGGRVFSGSRHWLTLQTATDYLIIRLEDRNMVRVLSSIEARTGSKVVRAQAEPEEKR